MIGGSLVSLIRKWIVGEFWRMRLRIAVLAGLGRWRRRWPRCWSWGKGGMLSCCILQVPRWKVLGMRIRSIQWGTRRGYFGRVRAFHVKRCCVAEGA